MLIFHRQRRFIFSCCHQVYAFQLSTGFSKPVDVLTGMSVNLVEVDAWQEEFARRFDSDSTSKELSEAIRKLVEQAEDFFSQKALQTQAKLESFSFEEIRGWGFFWKPSQSFFQTKHIVEDLGAHDALEMFLRWKQNANSLAELSKRGDQKAAELAQSSDWKKFDFKAWGAEISVCQIRSLRMNQEFLFQI